MKKTIILTFLSVALTAQYQARGQTIGPSTLNATGGTAFIQGTGTFDWSIGEMTLVSTYIGNSLVVTQGVLQPDGSALDVAQTQGILQSLRVFPNPASSVVNLQFTSQAKGKINYTLLDMAGKTILQRSVAVMQGTTSAQINVSGLSAASYLLKVSLNIEGTPEQSTSYKIQKLNQ